MRIFVFFFLFLFLDNLYANTMYMQLVEEDSELLKIGDVMSFLNADPDAKVVAKRSFAPVSNVGSTYIESQSQAMRGTIIRSDGTEEKF